MTTSLYLIAHVDGRGLAIDTAAVESVVDIDAVVPVPGSVPAVRGLAALRSRVVTVIDTRIAVGLPPATRRSTRAVITHVEGHAYAILVDTLEDVAPYPMMPLPADMGRASPWRAAARGVVERDGEPLLVVDLSALVPGHAPVAA